jgi:hypothetical protein
MVIASPNPPQAFIPLTLPLAEVLILSVYFLSFQKRKKPNLPEVHP